ncbi:hypothetical protein ACHIPZ_18320 [Antrihabitans sp. NCIMB 15449]|uniref:Uncharacterized protein n=1 Tax=Antrihabitans spumae TaxID=3373370 RepID=A0ABW7JQ57_9NOCA
MDQPLRVAEFDSLFRTAVRQAVRPSATRLDLVLSVDAEATARDLADKETRCCSFLAFVFEPDGDVVVMRIEVPETQVAVLDALERRVSVARFVSVDAEKI